MIKKRPTKKVFVVLCLTATYLIAEIIGGILSNSLALLADAGHMFADVAALSISLLAFLLSARPPTLKATYGYYRAEVIAALINGMVLLLVAFFIIKEAILRIFYPSEVESLLMVWVAVGGLVVNLIGLSILQNEKAKSLNVRGAWLHVFSDTLGSVGVVVSGLLIYFFDWQLSDSIASIVIAILVSYSAIQLVLDTIHVLMEHAPAHIDSRKVKNEILSLKNAIKIHDLHIWSITSGKDTLSVHVIAKPDANYDELLLEIQKMLKNKFAIEHSTIQIEKECAAKETIC